MWQFLQQNKLEQKNKSAKLKKKLPSRKYRKVKTKSTDTITDKNHL
jgi:hypothetical protein